MAGLHALRSPWGATAELVDALRNLQRYPGALQESHEGIGRALAAALRAKHGVHAGRQVNTGGLRVAVTHAPGQAATGLAALAQLRLVLRQIIGADEAAAHVGDLLDQLGGQQVRAGKRQPGALANHLPVLGGSAPQLLLRWLGLLATQALDELAGIDTYRAGGAAHRVHRAGLDAHVFIGLIQLGYELAIAGFFRALAGAAHHDALAWGQREIARRADRLAVAALHAAVHFLFHGGVELDVFDVRIWVIVQDDAWVHRVGGIAGPLEFLHDRVEFVAVLAAYIRRHGAAGAVLGLEVALGRENQVHHALIEIVIPTNGVIAFKAVREQEVDIAVLGVAENDGIVIAITGK